MTNTLPHDHQLQQKHEQAPVVAHKPQMMKKQTRRRTHASRPYQERLLNMAEARREIVTALKIHRANMRQQPTYQHQESTLLRRSPSPLQLRQQQEQQQPQQQVVFRQDRSQAAVEEAAAPPAPTSYAAAASFADHQLCNPLAQWIAAAAPSGAGSYCYSSPVLLPYDLTPLEAPTAAMGGVDVEWHGLEHLARSLPAQPLGLNLSFHGFGGGFVDAANDSEDLFGGAPLIQSSSSPAASSHAAYSPIATAEVASGTLGSPALSSTAEKYSSSIDAPAAALIPVAPDDGETRPVGEAQGGVGLCEAATAADVSAASAWWSKILLESVGESGGEVVEGGAAVGCTAEDVASSSAAAGLPAEWRRWLCDDGAGEQGAVTGADKPPPDVVLETMHAADGDYNNCCYQGGHRSDGGADDGITALPCLDDIEGWDGEWFSCSS